MIGHSIGPYRILAKIGEGGMGEVYRAADTNLKREVALKVLPPAVAGDPERMARFRREAQVLAALNHPNIAAIYGLETAPGSDNPASAPRQALVMELVEGSTLADLIARSPGAGTLSLDDALAIARQIVDAVEVAHEQGIIHRDLKPANIKVRPDGTVKVLDFGLAKALAPDAASATAEAPSQAPTITTPALLTRAGMVLGTAAYMSPEQARGKPVDRRADIWAFGCILYEMLTGRRAFAGDDVAETIGAVIHTAPDWTLLPPDTPASVVRVVTRCLEKDPRRRLRDIGEARMALEESASAEALVGVPDNSTHPRMRRTGAWITTGLVALVAGALAASTAWSIARRTEPADPPLRLAMSLRAGESVEPLRGLAVSADGQAVAFVSRPGRGEPRLVIRRLSGQVDVAVDGTNDASSPFFSPDGQWLGFFSQGTLKKVPTSGGSPQALTNVSNQATGGGGAWSEDGTVYFTGVGGIWKVPSAGGDPERVTTVRRDRGEINHRWPTLVPGSRALLYVAWTGPSWDERQIVVRQLDTGEERSLLKGGATVRFVAPGHLIYTREGRLTAVPFDASRLEVTGPPAPLLDDVREGLANSDYDVSPAGTLVYVHQSRGAYNRVLVLVDRQGVGQPLAGVPPGFYQNPRFSPDGRRALMQRSDSTLDLWLYNFDRQTMTVLKADGSSQNPAWSPDGQSVVYRGTRQGFRNLFVRPVDDMGAEQRLTTDDHVQMPWSWENDVIAFEDVSPETNGDIWLLPMSGSRARQPIAQTPFDESKARLSPDGRAVAYVSNESGRNQVYLQAVGTTTREQISTDGGTDPVWARSGRELFYRNGPQVMVVTVGVGGEPTSRPQLLFAGNYVIAVPAIDFDVSPDGRHFLMIRTSEPETPSPHIEVFLNWREELSRLRTGQ